MKVRGTVQSEKRKVDSGSISTNTSIIYFIRKIALSYKQTRLIGKSLLVQLMAGCLTSHYPNLCWPRSMSTYGVTEPHWVKLLITGTPHDYFDYFFEKHVQNNKHRRHPSSAIQTPCEDIPQWPAVYPHKHFRHVSHICVAMMTSSNGNIFRVTGHLCGEFTGPRWIPHTKASDAELWCFVWSASE